MITHREKQSTALALKPSSHKGFSMEGRLKGRRGKVEGKGRQGKEAIRKGEEALLFFECYLRPCCLLVWNDATSRRA